MPMPKKARKKCLSCRKETPRPKYKYCSNACQFEYQYQSYIKKWKAGETKGLQGMGIVSGYIKRYLRRKFENKCCLCGWSRVNPKTGQSPLVADHIDGNWRNNVEANLRLLCPNCDALTPTYAGLNRGNGRKDRVLSKRAKEGRLLLKDTPK
ncbi:MAG: HNH endonuclease [bacterium]|nr:HNH endonuclease [bacterium]